jgi:hypothetical protein
MKYFILLSFLSFAGQSYAQHSEKMFSIHATLIDSLNQEPIPFASIYKTRDYKGTITDFKGDFVLDNIQQHDTIVCSFIGYARTVFVVDKLVDYDTIYIHREAQLIEEVIVLANDSFLYKLVSNSRKSSSYFTRIAKTYFELETFQNDTQLELFQGYYNGTYKGYDVSNLEMKNARFALTPIEKRIFASTETSKAMYLQKLMLSNEYFPSSPFEINSKQLRKSYTLSLASRYKDEDRKTVYVINFEPQKNLNENFQGTVWIDSISNNILKVKLRISKATVFPFQSIWPFHSLEMVNMEITKSFIEEEGSMFLKSIDFDYDLTYKSTTDTSIHISTRAVLYAYNYEEEFLLPFFDFPETSNSDYRRIQMLPYNNTFWECTDEFKMENKSNQRNLFLNELATITTYDLFSSDTIFKRNFFEHPYVTWNGNRILFREESNDSTRYDLAQGTIPSQRYHLEVQFFLDINELCDSLQIITKTIFDPYSSYYKFPTTKEGQAFINIYFDLMEIERRKMEIKLMDCGDDIDMIKLKYNESKKRAEKISEIYFKEIERGTNKENLVKWNNVVLRELKIDNISLFKIEL